ncbi:MAG: ribosome biogenesis GTPase YlqF [Lachnospiraceae bacterium]|nr:ribosome biogenesis GTPase YlqF [Lachnospiraceae bacterium]
MNIQWYPGHMTKALRRMKEDMKLIDLVIEILDARVPVSSRNPDIDELAQNKSRIVILNKADLADPEATSEWNEYFTANGMICIPLNARVNHNTDKIRKSCMEACAEKIERDRKRGIKNRPIRVMVAGIPNVGKSTFINSFAGRASTKTGNKPGVTKGNQWIRIDKQIELLDTPGILWPKFEDPVVGRNLALIGSINDEVLSIQELCEYLIEYINKHYPDALNTRYEGNDFEAVAKRLGCIGKGGEYDYTRVYKGFLDDFRSGKLGRINLEVTDHE